MLEVEQNIYFASIFIIHKLLPSIIQYVYNILKIEFVTCMITFKTTREKSDSNYFFSSAIMKNKNLSRATYVLILPFIYFFIVFNSAIKNIRHNLRLFCVVHIVLLCSL